MLTNFHNNYIVVLSLFFNRKLYKRLESQSDNDVRELSEEGFTFLAKRYKSTQYHKVET